jgi:hypothetical protein
MRTWHSLAVVLTSIDTIYWPPIWHRYRDFETWRAVRQEFDPAATLDWLELDDDEVTGHASTLRVMAKRHNVLGDFHDLVRRADPQSWESLRGEAGVAMDYYIAADLLDAFADDAAGREDRAPVMNLPMASQPLTARPRSLDAVLTDLRVSPHPSVIVGVEGATERLIVPRVAKLLGVILDPAWIQVEEFGARRGTSRCSLDTPRGRCWARTVVSTCCWIDRQPVSWS